MVIAWHVVTTVNLVRMVPRSTDLEKTYFQYVNTAMISFLGMTRNACQISVHQELKKSHLTDIAKTAQITQIPKVLKAKNVVLTIVLFNKNWVLMAHVLIVVLTNKDKENQLEENVVLMYAQRVNIWTLKVIVNHVVITNIQLNVVGT